MEYQLKPNSKYLWQLTLFLLTLTACFLRLWNLGDFSLSNDELSALSRLQYNSLSDVISIGVQKLDFHPAGIQIFLFYWIKIAQSSEFLIRLPFALSGGISVWLIYSIGKHWFSKQTGILAAILLCFLEFPLLYSQLARPYSFGLFFTLLGSYLWTQIVFQKNHIILFLNFMDNISIGRKINRQRKRPF